MLGAFLKTFFTGCYENQSDYGFFHSIESFKTKNLRQTTSSIFTI